MTSPSGDVEVAKSAPVYEKRAVVFLDILGFSDVITTRGAELEI